MDTIHLLKVSPETRKTIKEQAIRLHNKGKKEAEIADALNISYQAVSRIIRAYKKEGMHSVKERTRGRKHGEKRSLTPQQEKEIQRTIIDKCPDQVKIAACLWTRAAIQQLIKNKYGITVPVRSISNYLDRWGMTCQRPTRRAYSQDDVKLKTFMNETYPAIAAKAKKEGAEIYWGDETGINNQEYHVRGFAPKGQTPTVPSFSKVEKINMISAINNKGTCRFMCYEDSMNQQRFIEFMKRLIHDADKKRMAELVAMNDIAELISSHTPATQVRPLAPLTKIQQQWLDSRLSRADFGEEMRLHYYVGTALKDEGEVAKAFSSLSHHILASTLQNLQENKTARISRDDIEVKLPLRVNWGGGWSDTPPYCNENGGTVLNAAITLSGQRPVAVRLRRLEERKIVFESADMDVHGEFTTIAPLQSVGDPFDSFVLQKAALLACGVIPSHGGSLEEVLERLGGGIWMDTEVMGVPKGSGLGTSSILAAACVKAIFQFLGMEAKEEDLYSTVLCMEQIMSTGGGWQDQVGGVTDGIKYISSRPGLNQTIKVQHIDLEESVWKELNDRFTLIYTGQRRLARNLLRDIVGRYIGNEPEAPYSLNEIQRNATLQRFELERGNVDAFAELLSQHWELSKMLDSGSTNTLIDQIFDSIEDLVVGKMICGAGGGGFLQVVLKKGVSKDELQARLKSVFSDTDISVWNCELV